MCILSACMSEHHMHAWCLCRSEEGIRSSETGVTDGWKPMGAMSASFSTSSGLRTGCLWQVRI